MAHSDCDCGHSHTQSHQHNYAQANKEHFDKTAHVFDEFPGVHEVTRDQAEVMKKAYPFDKDSTTVMDFACGTGLISKHLVSHAKSVLGVDISEGVVERYNARVLTEGHSPHDMKAVAVELKGVDGELDGAKFDVIVCTSAYHHVDDINSVTRTLAFFLKPGGKLLVFDMLPSATPVSRVDTSTLGKEHAKHFKDSKMSDLVPHTNGSSKETIDQVFTDAGLVDFTFDDKALKAVIFGMDVHYFLATGMKPLEVV